MALQYLLNTPEDKIVWDTSNQAYTTSCSPGVGNSSHPCSQYGGLSGFCKREESAYDTFTPDMLGFPAVPPPSAWWVHGSSGVRRGRLCGRRWCDDGG